MKGRPMWGPDAAVVWFAYETARKTERERVGGKIVDGEERDQCIQFYSPWQGVWVLFRVQWESTRG